MRSGNLIYEAPAASLADLTNRGIYNYFANTADLQSRNSVGEITGLGSMGVGNLVMAIATGVPAFEWLDLFAGVFVILVVYVAISWIFPHPVLKLWWWFLTHTFYRIRVIGLENIPKTGPALLISNHVSYIDWVLLFAACPRRLRLLVWSGYWRNPVFAFFLNWVRAIPIESRHPTAHAVDEAFNRAKRAARTRPTCAGLRRGPADAQRLSAAVPSRLRNA